MTEPKTIEELQAEYLLLKLFAVIHLGTQFRADYERRRDEAKVRLDEAKAAAQITTTES